MDGFKGRLNDSIQIKLSVILSLVILLAALLAGILSFLTAFNEAHELQDDLLRQVAQLLDRQPLNPPIANHGDRLQAGNEEARVIVQPLDDHGTSRPGGVDAGGRLALPSSITEGIHTLDVDGESFRVMIRTTSTGERIAVAQEAGFRNEIARDSAFRTVLPLLVLVPVLLALVTNLVRKMFLQIDAASREVDLRHGSMLQPVNEEGLPREVKPFVTAVNRLLTRLSEEMDRQRRFIADAAHELRTPLTALSLQAERLEAAAMSDEARQRLGTLHTGIIRTRRLLDNLLSLAKAQAGSDQCPLPVSVPGVFRQVLEYVMPLAESRRIDIGVVNDADIRMAVAETDLFTVLKNLVENAVRYTPEGGRVDMETRQEAGRVMVTVRDNGPGIPESERQRVFDPFYRILGTNQEGSGLGLAIVVALVQRLGATIRLEDTDSAHHTGLTVTLTFPADILVRQASQGHIE